ncbi:MAG: tRNA (adenosine(37)-N6)-threonylcarbamoyltransferase complex dimerization subunit type 1 TsaB [Dehalococcoidales bacterium]|nr:tRNA (adenosine(37)-N6)-threonylcarbamoyltransferase complex dimerization subunit type 1 TsaB [Dehalococcoidales bacterium]
MYLAIDTSSSNASLALIQDRVIIAELTWHCEQNHSVELMPRLTGLLEQAGVTLRSLAGIVVGRGPGSFNGLRVGISTAKGLSFSLNVPIVGISTLEAAAHEFAETGLPVCAVLGAGRSELAAAIYHKQKGRWRQIMAEQIITAEHLCSKIKSKTIFCGEPPADALELIKRNLGQKAIIPSPAARLRRAGLLAELGWTRLEAGDNDHPASLQPIYLRRPQITQPKKAMGLAGRGNIKLKDKAVIWDMDGIIIDSAHYHLEAWQQVFSGRGIDFSEKDFQRTFGQRNDAIISGILGAGASVEEIEAISSEKEAGFRRKIAETPKPLPGVIALMASLARENVRMAIASSAPRENIELISNRMDIARCVRVVISEEDVIKGKPDPQGFLLAASRLGVKPKNCLVIEDAVTGVAAAKRAGMCCLAVTNSHTRDSLGEADLVVDSLEEVAISDIEGLLGCPDVT